MGHHAEVHYQCKTSTCNRACKQDIGGVQMNGSTGSEQQLKLGKDISHLPSSTFFSKGLCLMLYKNVMETLAKVAKILPIRAQLFKTNNVLS